MFIFQHKNTEPIGAISSLQATGKNSTGVARKTGWNQIKIRKQIYQYRRFNFSESFTEATETCKLYNSR